MAKDKYRPTLVLPSESERPLAMEAAKRGVSLQKMMRSAVLSLLESPVDLTMYRQVDFDVLDSLFRIEAATPGTATLLRELIYQIARELDGPEEIEERRQGALGKAARIVEEMGRDESGHR